MRAVLTSVAVIAAAGATIAAGGAFSVFNDQGASTGSFAAGTVKLAVTGEHPDTDIFALTGPCTSRYQDAQSPTDALNLGTVNNTGCTSTFTVHNAGSLPMELSGTTLTDSNPIDPVKLACFTSTIPAADTAQTAPLLPGTDRVLHVRTITSSDDKNCQNITDKVNVKLIGTETVPQVCVTWGLLGSPVGATQFCDSKPIVPTDASQAKAACETFYGATCYVEHADCAGAAFGPRPLGAWRSGELYFGYASGCSGSAGRIWPIGNSYTTRSHWA